MLRPQLCTSEEMVLLGKWPRAIVLRLDTHLPQLAALANTHLLIAKEERQGRTYTSVTPLDLEGRKRELARIIGGTNITETTLKSAEEMLNA